MANVTTQSVTSLNKTKNVPMQKHKDDIIAVPPYLTNRHRSSGLIHLILGLFPIVKISYSGFNY